MTFDEVFSRHLSEIQKEFSALDFELQTQLATFNAKRDLDIIDKEITQWSARGDVWDTVAFPILAPRNTF